MKKARRWMSIRKRHEVAMSQAESLPSLASLGSNQPSSPHLLPRFLTLRYTSRRPPTQEKSKSGGYSMQWLHPVDKGKAATVCLQGTHFRSRSSNTLHCCQTQPQHTAQPQPPSSKPCRKGRSPEPSFSRVKVSPHHLRAELSGKPNSLACRFPTDTRNLHPIQSSLVRHHRDRIVQGCPG